MNKIFKVIWSKSKQCYVVVSELAKNTTGKKKIVVASILAALMAGQAMQVEATKGDFYDTGSTKGAIAIGKSGSTAPQATDENAIAIGQAARANGRGGVALGNDTRSAQNAIAAAWDSQATGKNSVAVGTGTRATGLSSTAVGDGAQATANGAVALGQSTESAGNSVAAGFNAKARSNNTVAIGVEANNDGGITNNASSVSVGVATRARAVGSMAMGVSADASGKYSLALGSGDVSGDYTDGTNHPSASGEKSIAIGHNSNASDESAIAIGSSSISDKTSATALGRNTTATGVNSSAIGAYSIASDTDATALGRNANATAAQSTALGTYSKAFGTYSTGVGYQANASGSNSTAVGVSAKANKEDASAMGPGARAYGNGAISFGYQALSGANIFNSAGNGSFNDASPDVTSYAKWGDSAIGLRAIASGGNATALGRSATATAANAIAIGGGNGNSATDNTEKTEATGEKATAIGYNAKAKTGNDLAVGRGVTSSGGAATSVGYYATASGNQTVALGSTINSTAQYATGIGYSVNSQGEGSVAIGAGTDALGVIPAKQVKATAKNAIAIGRATQATSQDATAIGTEATASNTDAIAIGRKSNASGSTSIGFGYNTQSTATNTVAIGTDVSATAESAIALGRKTKASDLNATAVGPIANASGKYSSAFGMNAAASKENSLALGTNANASLDKSVALGSDSTTATNATSQGSVVIGGKTITWNGAPTVSGTGMQVSVGAAGAERQIKNVAAGEVSANSTDAINGSQLYAVADVLNQANADQSIKYKANGTGSNSVKLSDGLNFTNGNTTTATVGANGQVSFDLNTATKQSIADSATAVARTVSLGGDTGTTTAKSLSSGNVNFGIKSGSPTYLTTKATGNDVTLTINEQAIKNAAKDASSFKVKANTTAAEDVKGGDTVTFNNGDNIAITQTGKTFKIATAKNVTFDAATIGGNTTIGSTGVTTNKVTVGAISIDGTNGINAGNKAITHVGTGIVANSNADNSNVANIGDVKTIANDAVANLSTSLGVTDGTNSGTVNLKNQSLKVVGTGVAKATVNGQTITVDVAKGTLTNNTTTGALTGTAGVVDANDMATAVNTAITKAVDTATGTQKLDVSAGGTDSSVNLKTQKLTVAGAGAATASLTGQTITVNVAEGTFTNKSDGTTSATAGVAKAVDVAAAINNTNAVLGNKITEATQSLSTLGDNKFKLTADSTSTTGQALNKSGGLSFKIAGDGDLVSTSATTDTVNVTVKKGTLTNAADGSLNVTNSGVVTADNMKSVVNDAITKAVTSAKDGSAWNLSTNGGTATKVSGGNTVDLINGDNIEITQDGTDGKKITVKTKKDLTLDSVTAANAVKVGSGTNLITLDGTTGGVSGNSFTAGNASMNTTGFRVTGGPSVTTAGIDAGGKQITNMISGGTVATNAATIGDVNTKVTTAINDLTTNLTKNTNIAYTANTATPGQTVSLKDGFKFTNGTLTTAEVAAGGVVKFNVTQGTLSTDTNGTVSAGTPGVATTSDVASAVNSAVTTAVTNATGNQKLDISAGGTDSSVNLKTQKLTVAGTGAATASLNGQTITVDVAQGTFTNKSDGTTSATAGVAKAADVASAINNANTALSQKITDATTSLGTLGNNTFTLKADSTDTTAQALNKSGGLAFKVAGDGDLVSTSATTDTVKVTVKKGELSNAADGSLNVTDSGVVTADNMKTVVNDAITKAVTSAKDGSAWNISTNGGTATKVSGGNTVDLINGDNIEITQDGTDGKKITVKTKKDLTVDSVTAGNTVINTSGLTNGTTAITGTGITTDKVTVGGLSIDKTAGINAGNKAITNVGTGIVANSNADNSNVANIGDVKTIANDAVANLSTNLGVTDGTNNGTVNLKTEKLKVVGTGAATATVNGQTVTVDVAKGTLAANAVTGALTGTAGVVDANDMATAVNTAITKAVDNATGTQALKIGGDTTATGSVNLKSDTLSVKGDNKFITTAASGNDITLTVNEQAIKTAAKDAASFKVKANSEAEQEVKGGETVVFNDGDNIEITQTGKTFKIATSKNVTFDTATIGGNTTIGSTGITTNKVTVGGISIDGTNGINAGSKQITNVASGGTTATNAANIGDINAAISSLTTNLGKNTTIAYKANNAGGQTVSLADGFNFTNGTLTTAEVGASGVVKFNVTQGALSTDTNGTVSAGTAGVATTADVASAVNSAVSTAVNNATGNQKLDISAGGTDSSVNLKTQKLTVAGTGAATASLNGQTITVDVAQGTFTNKSDGTTSATAGVAKAADVASAINNANTALSQKITDATTSLGTLGNNTFTLKADSTDTSAQNLNKSGGLAFKVAGDGDLVSTSATTDAVKVTVKKGTLSTNADGTINKATDGVVTTDNMTTVVNDAITKAVTSAKDGSAWNISTNGGTATKVSGGNTVDLINGDNIEITQDGTDGKKITVKTKKDLTLDSVTAANAVKVGSGTNLITLDGTTGGVSGNSFTAGNASMNTTGFRVTGGPSVTTAGIDAGGKQITNMISGGTVATNAATIGDVNTKVTTAINDLTTNLTKNTNIAYTANTATPGQTVSLKDGFNFSNGTLTTAEVAANGVVKFNVTQGSLSTDGNGNITNTAGVATTDDVKNAVNTAITKAVDNATGTQKLDISAGGTDSSVNLKTQKLTVAGTGAATASLNNQTITVDVAQGTFTNKSDGTTSATAGVAKASDVAAAINNANTVLNQKISDATTSLGTLGNNTFTLKADSTDTTAQALNKSGGLAFKVAGDSDLVSTSATADTVKVTVKKGTLSTNTDGTINKATDGVVTADNMTTVVNDAITKAVTSAKDGSAWNISTNGGTATKVSGGNTVDLINGDNIEITQDGTDGKKITVKTKKDLTVDSVTAANTVKVGSATNLITLDGATGGVSGNTFTAGNASMNTTGFRLTGGPSVTTTGIDAGNTVITNVASGGTTSTNAANIGDITKAISDLTTNLTKNTSISYTANNDTPVKTVSLKDGFKFTDGTLTTAEVAAGGVVKFNVTQGSLSTDGNGNITNTAGVATTDDVKNAVNTAINKAVTNSSTAVNTLGANTFTLTGDNSTSTTGQALNKNGGLSFKVAGDGNFITTSAATDTVTVSIKQGTFGSNTDGTAKSTTNGVATTNDVANIVNTTVTNAVTKATGSQVLNITDGTNNDSINLKNDTLKVVGSDGVTTEVSGKTITVGLDTVTKNKINNASAATNKNISLAADTGTTSSQSLKDGDVSFAVKGATGDYISTNMNGSTVEISTKRATIDSNATTGQASVTGNDGLATAKNVADAINAATAKAVSQSAWKLAADGTTGTETISGGDTVNFKAGSNMEVSRTGKDITYKTKDNVAFTTVTAGTGANEVKLDGNTGTVTAKDITATGDVTAKNVTTSGNVTAAGTLKGDTVQGNTVKAGNVTITGGTTNTITGLSNTTWTPAGGIQADRAATEGQLQQAINQVNATVGSTALTFKGDTNPAQSMTLQGNTFAITGDTMIKTTTNTNGIGLSLDTSKVNIAYAANGANGQTTSLTSGFNFTDGDYTKATVAANGVVKYDAKTSSITVANGQATASGTDLATADNVAHAINQMTQANAGNTTQLRQEINKVATETQRIGAHAAAMAALKPIQYDPLEPTQVMAGVGNYHGETAAALGLAHYTNENTMFNVGVSLGGNHNMVNAGVTHKFGSSPEKKNIPDRYKAGPISSIYVMQDEMTQLRSENEAYKAKLDKQQSEIDALKAAVDQLLASKA
ncbi:ESPR-type extended signal peptide-containing protein [Veillonella atypica]|uniref:ESPR-type extended signal peptide-containing protein n=1 Tax=Veillonella atypica TaxID=39777 RepID=UPI0039935D4D